MATETRDLAVGASERKRAHRFMIEPEGGPAIRGVTIATQRLPLLFKLTRVNIFVTSLTFRGNSAIDGNTPPITQRRSMALSARNRDMPAGQGQLRLRVPG